MPQLCLYFQLHQPYRLKNFNVFSIGNHESYFSEKNQSSNKKIFQKVTAKSYLPMLKLLTKLANQHPDFKFSLSCSGVFLEQALLYKPEIIDLVRPLVKQKQVELLAETYYHSLAFIHSKKEFLAQIKQHLKLIKKIFNYQPRVFRNTELIYSNYIADLISNFNFLGILTEAVDYYLKGEQRTQVFISRSTPPLPLLLKHAQLSDDIAFRFSDRHWQWYPLSVDRYLDWIEVFPQNEIVNLFMDFETFGEHQWADTGIFTFFEKFITRFMAKKGNRLVTPSEIFQKFNAIKSKIGHKTPIYDVPEYISWADVDRSLTAWLGNQFQRDTIRILYALEDEILTSADQLLIADWRKLQTSDHFYYMCTKWSADGDVHAYFSPYDSPFEAYRRYSVVLADLKERLLSL